MYRKSERDAATCTLGQIKGKFVLGNFPRGLYDVSKFF
jgi:hypothetical protein